MNHIYYKVEKGRIVYPKTKKNITFIDFKNDCL